MFAVAMWLNFPCDTPRL